MYIYLPCVTLMAKKKIICSDLEKTLPTRFKRLKNQKVCVICIICRFHKIEQCFYYMHAKFQVAGFQNKRDIRNRSLDFVCLFLLGHLPVQVTRWALASDSSEIFRLVWKISDQSIKTSHQTYATYFLILQ